MSPITGTPAALARTTLQCGSGWVRGTPGASTRAWNDAQSALDRSSSSTPSAAATARDFSFSSLNTGCAPPAFSARAAGSPLRPRPKIATRCPSKPRTVIIRLAQLERGQADQGQERGHDPEADHDGRLGPAQLLEMVVDRGHQEHPLLGQLVVADLDHHRERLDHEEAADDAQHDLVLGADRAGAERAAQSQRTGVAHEDLGRRGVV